MILGTIRENLLYGKHDATEQDMMEALKKASAMFVFQMEKGLDTYVGSGSVLTLSGGQKQRIAIARALIKKPAILILDEATSALDTKSELEVQGAIDKIALEAKNNMTILMIAHRISTIQSAQNLLYLEDNSSVLAGTKGTPEYDALFERLLQHNYSHQKDQQNDNEGKQTEGKDIDEADVDEFGIPMTSRRMISKKQLLTPLPEQIISRD